MDGYEIVEILKQGSGRAIGIEANDGNTFAKSVIQSYTRWQKTPGDPMAKMCFEADYTNYLDSKKGD